MAQILRSESSLLKRQLAIGRELSRGTPMRIAVWGAALAAAALLGTHSVLTHTWHGAIFGALALVFAVGYEVHLREIAVENRNLEGGRHGERQMAERLAEQLADDHVILNDLELRVAHERAQIDHLVIAPSGIYVIESKFWAGTLTGDVHDAQWTQTKTNGTVRRVKSPVEQCERQRRMFITLLAAKVPEDRIHALAVFTHPAVRLQVANAKGRAFLVRDAIRFINDRCFEPPVLTPAEALALAERINRGQA
ncbi:MAG: nuclease-related domain-containing protein [Kiritimatiellia bacterium]